MGPRVTTVAGIGTMNGPKIINGLTYKGPEIKSLTQALPLTSASYCHSWVPILTTAKADTEHLMQDSVLRKTASHSAVWIIDYMIDHQITRRGYTELLLLWIEQWLILTRMIPSPSGYGFAFSAFSASSHTASKVLQNAWFIDMTFALNTVSDQSIYPTVRRRWHLAYNCGTHFSLYIPDHQEAW